MLRLSGLRKRTQPLKYRRIAARVTDAELALIQHAAELQGQSVTCFVLATLQKEAMQVIGTMEAGRAGIASGEPGGVLLGAPREQGEYRAAAKKRSLKVAGSK
jgi:uncharacterized protein (DUF1778 family)